MIGNTERLFLLLLRLHRSDVVCDIGSLDATLAKRFRRGLPRARVIAFEANPRNVAAMEEDRGLGALGIEVHGAAVGNTDGEIGFHTIPGPEGNPDLYRAIGSTRLRSNEDGPYRVDVPANVERVAMVRLDTVLQDSGGSIALWIDAEGGAFEVLEGAHGCLSRVTLIHVEVETVELWTGQKSDQQVQQFLEDRGFTPVLRRPGAVQSDVVFVRHGGPSARRLPTLAVVLLLRVLIPFRRMLRRFGMIT